jgi:hypothetical protein
MGEGVKGGMPRSTCATRAANPASPTTLRSPFSATALPRLLFVRCFGDHRRASCLDRFLASTPLFRVLSAGLPLKIAQFSTFRVHVFNVFISDYLFCKFVMRTELAAGEATPSAKIVTVELTEAGVFE